MPLGLEAKLRRLGFPKWSLLTENNHSRSTKNDNSEKKPRDALWPGGQIGGFGVPRMVTFDKMRPCSLSLGFGVRGLET